MFVTDVPHDVWLSRFIDHLQKEKYQFQVVRRRVAIARRFLAYLSKRAICVEEAQALDLALYLQSERQRYHRRHHHRPASVAAWQNSYTGGLHILLRLVQGQWPPLSWSSAAHDRFQTRLIQEYEAQMQDRRGLAAETRTDRCGEARRFLVWLGLRGTDTHLRQLGVAELDAYVKSRALSVRRVTLKGISVKLRDFLRYLHATGRTNRDLSAALVGPRVYADEGIPSTLQAEDVARVLDVTHADRSAIGRRDYAILMLLARYGLRAGEVTALRLDDLDWRHDRLRIHHGKTGVHSELPLRNDVGDAILRYLLHGRPQVTCREVFIRGRAPYRPLRSGSSLYAPIRRRIETAGITPPGKKGPHVFRHTRAVTLIRAAVPAKQIGDILGHRSADSTAVYLKLATADLRAICLEIPMEVTA